MPLPRAAQEHALLMMAQKHQILSNASTSRVLLSLHLADLAAFYAFLEKKQVTLVHVSRAQSRPQKRSHSKRKLFLREVKALSWRSVRWSVRARRERERARASDRATESERERERARAREGAEGARKATLW